MKRNTIETVLGAVVLFVAGFFLYFAYSTSTIKTTKGYTLSAKFDRIDGLVIGSDVRIGGVKIGSITHLDVDPATYQAEVQFTIQQSINVPTDSSAEITSAGLLGDKFLAIIPGGDDTFLKQGEEVSLTQSSVNLEQLIGQAIFSSTEKEDKGKESDKKEDGTNKKKKK